MIKAPYSSGKMSMKISCIFFVTFLSMSTVDGRLQCQLLFGEHFQIFNLSQNAANTVAMITGRTLTNMQTFKCYCPTSNEFFDDNEVTSIDREFFKANEYDWTQSQIFQIHNCTTLTLSMKSGRNTFSYLLKGKILIVENVSQLILTDFTAGSSSVTTEDDTFSSIYFRNVVFYQIPPYLEFDDRYEVLFKNVSTDEGSSKVEPFDIRVKNTNSSRNPVFRMEDSRFGGVNIITDGFTFNVFSLLVQNLQKATATSCNYDFKGSVKMTGNSFGYLRSRNIYISNGQNLTFERNFVEVLNSNAFDLTNLKETKVTNNNFGYLLMEPAVTLAFYSGGTSGCSAQDLPESSVTEMSFSDNSILNLGDNFLELNVDPGYSSNFVNRVYFNNTEILGACNCTNPSLGNYPTASERVGKLAIDDARCFSRLGVPGRRSDICRGIMPQSESQKLDERVNDVKKVWLIYLIAAAVAAGIVGIVVTAICCKCCCNSCCKG